MTFLFTYSYIVCPYITACAVQFLKIICMKMFKTKIAVKFNHLFVFFRTVNTRLKEENCRLILHMISNSKSPSLIENAHIIEVIIHWYAHTLDYAHISYISWLKLQRWPFLDINKMIFNLAILTRNCLSERLTPVKTSNWWYMWPWPWSVTSDQGNDKANEQSLCQVWSSHVFQKVLNCTWMGLLKRWMGMMNPL